MGASGLGSSNPPASPATARCVLSFETLEGGESESPLVLEDISSFKASTYLDSLHQPTPGHFGLDQGSLAPPSLVFY